VRLTWDKRTAAICLRPLADSAGILPQVWAGPGGPLAGRLFEEFRRTHQGAVDSPKQRDADETPCQNQPPESVDAGRRLVDIIYGRGSGNFGCSMVVISSRISPTAICACADVRPSAMRVWSTRRRNSERGSSGVSASTTIWRIAGLPQPRPIKTNQLPSWFLTIAEGLPCPPSLGHC
jgi:hypothetical protein